jgi:hypothetical protein
VARPFRRRDRPLVSLLAKPTAPSSAELAQTTARNRVRAGLDPLDALIRRVLLRHPDLALDCTVWSSGRGALPKSRAFFTEGA